MKTEQNATPRLIAVPDWPNHHPWPPVGGLRHLIHFAEKNGFEKVLRRIGRRVLIDETEFFKWAAEAAHLKWSPFSRQRFKLCAVMRNEKL